MSVARGSRGVSLPEESRVGDSSNVVVPGGLVVRDVEGWSLGFIGEVGLEPLVRDLDLAERLGFKRPRKIRDLIGRMVSDGAIRSVAKVRVSTSRHGGRPHSQYWLTHAHVSAIVTRSGVGASGHSATVALSARDEILAAKCQASAGASFAKWLNYLAEQCDRYAKIRDFGRVYFIRNATLGLIKIGFSTCTRTRLSSLENGCGVPLEFLTEVPGNPETERALHKRFAAHRATGEWFREAPELTSFIESLRRSELRAANHPAKASVERSRGAQASLFGTLKKAS